MKSNISRVKTPKKQRRKIDLSEEIEYLRWIEFSKPANHCNYNGGRGWFCSRPWCRKHGQFQRIKKATEVLQWSAPGSTPYSIVLHFNEIVTPEHLSRALEVFFDDLRRRKIKFDYVWTLEFVGYIPHINLSLYGYGIDGNLEVKSSWVKALTMIGHPSPTSPDVYCRKTKNPVKWVRYIFKVNKVLEPQQCPPKESCLRWRFWNHSRGFLGIVKRKAKKKLKIKKEKRKVAAYILMYFGKPFAGYVPKLWRIQPKKNEKNNAQRRIIRHNKTWRYNVQHYFSKTPVRGQVGAKVTGRILQI